MAKQYKTAPDLTIDLATKYSATLDTTHGEITIDLDPERSPQAVNNFVFLAARAITTASSFTGSCPGS